MSRITTVSLELLRHGPAHNQLLSPLTQYLALCGNHSAASVAAPYEHQELLGRLRILQYRGGGTVDDPDARTTREIQTQEMARTVGELLGGIRSLLAEIVSAPGEDSTILHLDLVLSASELSLLPFEIAATPDAFPGAGRSLLLQDQLPICLTRRVRRVDNRQFEWPQKPKILFAVAAPAGVGQVPVEAHLLALRKAVEPWLWSGGPQKELSRHLELLPDASVDALAAACRRGRFTHVHLLAHGVPTRIAGDAKFGIALHNPNEASKIDVVDGRRLAMALCAGETPPAVVTIASCDSGNVGSVISDGASVAHTLHEAGIPFVVGSQLPLSFKGSVLMVEALYACLLEGRDPRLALVDLRRKLFTTVPEAHDWASIVAYAALPPDFAEQVAAAEVRQAKSRIDAALSNLDAEADEALRPRNSSPPPIADVIQRLDRALERLPGDSRRLRALLPPAVAARKDPTARQHRTLVAGLLGSVDKRDAQITHLAATLKEKSTDQAGQVPRLRKRVRRSLSSSYDDYSIVVRTDFGQSWAMVQVVGLALVLDRDRARWTDLWTAARVASEAQLTSEDDQQVRWAMSALAELWTMAPAVGLPHADGACANAVDFADKLTQHPKRRWIDLHAALHQLTRFYEFFAQVPGSRFGEDDEAVHATHRIAKQLVQILQTALDEDPYFV